MITSLDCVRVPKALVGRLGLAEAGTRVHRQDAATIPFAEWFETVCEFCGPDGSMSPGALMLYADVSRTAVHKRMKEGKLTAFMYNAASAAEGDADTTGQAGGGRPYTFIPVVEARAWARSLQQRRSGAPARPDVQPSAAADRDSWRQW